jgi:hypothetical protein
MKAVYNLFIQTRIRLGLVLSLIFFVLLSPSCRNDEQHEISIVWKNNKAIGIIVPMSMLQIDDDSVQQLLHVQVEKMERDMLGDYSVKDKQVLFQPLVPLSRGLNYRVLLREKLIGTISVPADGNAKAPRLVAVYPSTDTVPENLLKMYFRFSKPMREGEGLQYIVLLDEKNDTLDGTFLDLQPELWNKERTILTLWLDPGRIKRDLVPNQQLGNPLKKGRKYTLIVLKQWRDTEGLELDNQFTKTFSVGERDDALPQPKSWELVIPKSATASPLLINLPEPLDYFLLEETILIKDQENKTVAGSLQIKKNETGIEFIPSQPWKAGNYKLIVASYLEDLSGNNLTRPFDRDITRQAEKKETGFFEKSFMID